MAKPRKNLFKLPHDSGTPVHVIRPRHKDILWRLDPCRLFTTALVLRMGDLSLFKRGWPLSARLGIAVDHERNPIPWYAYNATDYLLNILRKKPALSVFEYGLGQSTLWWAHHAAQVTTVEHDPRWLNAYQGETPDNVTVLHHHCHKGYEDAPVTTGQPYDIIVIDGMNRPACLTHALKALKPDGLLIWDDAHYPRYADSLQSLLDDGYTAKTFDDYGPVIHTKTRTTMFTKSPEKWFPQ